MIYREAVLNDISQIQLVRNAVKENRLSNPSLVTDKDVADYITKRGKGWVCELDKSIAGFAIADLEANNIWALFVHPDKEAMGIGSQLHHIMLNWYFSQTGKTVWLSTSPGTRAEIFYRKKGWEEKGVYGKGEIRFEMTEERFKKLFRQTND